MFVPILASVITAAIVGWLAYRGSGHWWTGLSSATAAFGLVTIVPFLAFGLIDIARGGSPADFTSQHGPIIIFVANVAAWAWLAHQIFGRHAHRHD